MYLCDGKIGYDYKVTDIKLPTNVEKRLEALGFPMKPIVKFSFIDFTSLIYFL